MRWAALLALACLAALAGPCGAWANDYLPTAAATKWVTAGSDGKAHDQVVILTVPLPGADQDSKEIAAFGILYGYSPRTVFVYRDQPTLFSFWNLQSSEAHDVMLTSPTGQVLMHVTLPVLKKTKITLTFHRQGLFNFYCTMHQPYMNGQIFVLPPAAGEKDNTTGGPTAAK